MRKNWTTFFTNSLFQKRYKYQIGIIIQQKALNFNSKNRGSKEFYDSGNGL